MKAARAGPAGTERVHRFARMGRVTPEGAKQ
jgi:hypothetical protein